MGEALLPVLKISGGSVNVIGYNAHIDNATLATIHTSIFEQDEITLDLSKTYLVMVISSTQPFVPDSASVKAAVSVPVIYTLAQGTLSPKLVLSDTSYTGAAVKPSINTATGVLSLPSTKVNTGSWVCAVSELT